MKRIFFIITGICAVLACTKRVATPPEKEDPSEFTDGVVAMAHDFTDKTKSSLDRNGVFSWIEGDVIGVVPPGGSTFHTNYTLKAIGSNARTAAFDGGAWGLRPGLVYVAYYPCQRVPIAGNGAAELTFTGQVQSANNSLAHLRDYDYMYAPAVVASDKKTTFDFEHKASILKVIVPISTSAAFTDLTLTCTDPVFATKALLSLNDGSLKSGGAASSMHVSLENIEVKAGEDLIVWLATVPATVSGKRFSVSLTTTGGIVSSYSCTSPVAAFTAGGLYSLYPVR